jgi:hypothetical protein
VDNNFTINSGYYYSVFYLKNMVSIVWVVVFKLFKIGS